MAINCLISKFGMFCRTLGFEITDQQARMMDKFISGETPYVAYTDARQTGKSTIALCAAILEAIQNPGVEIGFKGHSLRAGQHLLERIPNKLNPEVIKYKDNYSITFINDSRIRLVSRSHEADIIFHDEATFCNDGVLEGKKKTFAYGTPSPSGMLFRSWTESARVTKYFVVPEYTYPVDDLVLRTSNTGELEWADNYTQWPINQTVVLDDSIIHTPYTTGIDYAEPGDLSVYVTDGRITYGTSTTETHYVDG